MYEIVYIYTFIFTYTMYAVYISTLHDIILIVRYDIMICLAKQTMTFCTGRVVHSVGTSFTLIALAKLCAKQYSYYANKKKYIPSLKLTWHLKMDGWNTIVSFWEALFSGAKC